MTMARRLRHAGTALLLFLTAPCAMAAQQEGYIELPDGVGLKYTVLLPEGEGPFPTVLHYQGYAAGSDPNDNGLVLISPQLLERGIAVLGVSLRGTGCSEGDFDLFERQWVADGVDVIDWASRQAWSNGAIAMVGLSFPGMTQLMVGPERPAALKALLPWSAMTDIYRDVAYPGGIFNASFASAWTGIQKLGYTDVPNEVLIEGDARCAAAVAQQNDPQQIVFVQGQTAPYADADLYERFVPEGTIGQINVPVLFAHAWQDEQIASRTLIDYEQLDPQRTWHVYGNGVHGYGLGSALVVDTAMAFLERYLLGIENGFEATPRVQIEHEVYFGADGRWTEAYDRFPVPTRLAELYLTVDGGLQAQRPDTAGSVDYAYPLPAPSMTAALAAQTENQSYALPITPGGAAVFSTAPLSHDLHWFGPSRLDLDFSSTAVDTDLQVSLTEVRPDGQEMFIQRGWLRASHQALDLRHTRADLPHHSHVQADQTLLTPGEARRLSVEIWPVAHIFRAGSAVRIRVEAPLGTTGFRQLELNPTPAINSVHLGGADPTRLTFGLIPDAQAPVPLGPCVDRINQPCRAADGSVMPGSLSIPAARMPAPTSGQVRKDGDEIVLHNTTSSPHYLRALRVAVEPGVEVLELRAGEFRQSIAQPYGEARFEISEIEMAPDQELRLSLHAEAAGVAQAIDRLSSTAHARGPAAVTTSGGLLVLAWGMFALWGLRKPRSRAWLLGLGLCGALVGCSGGREGAGPRSAAASKSAVIAVEVVDAQGQFLHYAIAPD